MKPTSRRHPSYCAALCMLFWVLLLLPRLAYAADTVEIVISGVEDELRENVLAALSIPPGLIKDGAVNLPWLELFQTEIPQKVREALEPFGYYDAKADSVLQKPDTDHYRIKVEVFPGTPVKVTDISVRVVGAGAQEEALQRIARSFRLHKGDILDHSRYERGKARLQSKAQELGYLDATFPVHEIRVSRAEASARIALELDTGIQYRFGETLFTGAPQYPQRFLQRYLDYKVGEIFSEKKLGQTQINLATSDRFKGVLLTPAREDAHDDIMPVLAQ
ncbi:MAG: outer membrane protein assembly factor, partial [Deltaproteobacteria bacterium]|nr:outer membrane protein assembly factor [Deltaproteobacteria bacterium]